MLVERGGYKDRKEPTALLRPQASYAPKELILKVETVGLDLARTSSVRYGD